MAATDAGTVTEKVLTAAAQKPFSDFRFQTE